MTLMLLLACRLPSATPDGLGDSDPTETANETGHETDDTDETGAPEPDCETVRAALSGDAMSVASAGNTFGWDLYGVLPDGNLFFSPFSISTALSMVLVGANGTTEDAMRTALSVDLDDASWHAAHGELLSEIGAANGQCWTLSPANAIFGEQTVEFKTDFLDTLTTDYGAPLQTEDFFGDPDGATGRINTWVADHTEQKIPELFPLGMIRDFTLLVAANAVYFQGNWATAFDPDATEAGTFEAPSGAVTVEFMHATTSMYYGNATIGTRVQVAELPYSGGDLVMDVLLPDDLAAFDAAFSSDALNTALSDLRAGEVDLTFPKIELDESLDLVDPLTALGMGETFDSSGADFYGISDYPAYIGAVVHEGWVSVDEVGTEAAAATGVIVDCADSAPHVEVIRVDHPYVFVIRDTWSGAVLFIGRVVEPG